MEQDSFAIFQISCWFCQLSLLNKIFLFKLTEISSITCYACMLSCLSHVRLFVTWPIAHQAPLSMGFSRQEYWSGLSCPPPGDFPDPGVKISMYTWVYFWILCCSIDLCTAILIPWSLVGGALEKGLTFVKSSSVSHQPYFWKSNASCLFEASINLSILI